MFDTLGAWLNDSTVALFVKAHGWMFPALESIHVLGLTIVVGMIAIMDLRLLGIPSNARPVTELARETLHWVWGAFAIAVVSGLLMFVSQAPIYLENTAFLLKMGLLVLAGANMFYFELVSYKTVAQWNVDVATSNAAKVAACLSLTLWVGIVICGRIIGFTLNMLAGSDVSQYLTAVTP